MATRFSGQVALRASGILGLSKTPVCALWSPAGNRADLLALFGVSSVSLSLSHWYPGSGVVLDCIDS